MQKSYWQEIDWCRWCSVSRRLPLWGYWSVRRDRHLRHLATKVVAENAAPFAMQVLGGRAQDSDSFAKYPPSLSMFESWVLALHIESLVFQLLQWLSSFWFLFRCADFQLISHRMLQPCQAQHRHLSVLASRSTSRALDLGCGKGRHAMLLMDMGFEAVWWAIGRYVISHP